MTSAIRNYDVIGIEKSPNVHPDTQCCKLKKTQIYFYLLVNLFPYDLVYRV